MKRLRPEQDAFGRVLLERLDGNDRASIVIERADGYMDAEDAAAYFDGVGKWFPVERQALRYVRGRVLDVRAGAGRVALELQHRGRDFVSLPELETLARGTGWHVQRVIDKDGSDYYAAVFEKDSPR